MLVEILVQLCEMILRPTDFFGLVEHRADLDIFPESIPQLESDKDRLTVVPQLQTIIPIGRKAARKSMRPRAVEIELDGAPQMSDNGIFTFISIWEYFVEESRRRRFP